MNLPYKWAKAMYTGNMRSVANLRACMSPEQLQAGGRLLSDLRIQTKARRKTCI